MRLFSLLILCLIFIGYELTKDYCFEQHRRLTEKEYISQELSSFLRSDAIQTDSWGIQIHSWDNTVDSYLAHHPNCCTIRRSDRHFPFGYEVEVTIRYEMNNEGKKMFHNTHYEAITVLNECGKHIFHYGEAFTPTNPNN